MNFRDENSDERKVKELFLKAEREELHADPYMKKRIMARVAESSSSSRIKLWRGLALASPVAVAAILLMVFFLARPQFEANLFEKVLVNVEVKKIDSETAFAEIDLPEGLSFYSEKYPEIASLRSIRLAVGDDLKNGHIPIIVSSDSAGRKSIKIKFLSADERLITERSVNINFNDTV